LRTGRTISASSGSARAEVDVPPTSGALATGSALRCSSSSSPGSGAREGS